MVHMVPVSLEVGRLIDVVCTTVRLHGTKKALTRLCVDGGGTVLYRRQIGNMRDTCCCSIHYAPYQAKRDSSQQQCAAMNLRTNIESLGANRISRGLNSKHLSFQQAKINCKEKDDTSTDDITCFALEIAQRCEIRDGTSMIRTRDSFYPLGLPTKKRHWSVTGGQNIIESYVRQVSRKTYCPCSSITLQLLDASQKRLCGRVYWEKPQSSRAFSFIRGSLIFSSHPSLSLGTSSSNHTSLTGVSNES